MFFKRLELFGFKSFAQKTRLDFEAGVTAIVGPNGCGKSNISDSIKWVMGEQSVYSLRGTRMEDVIFHGADDIPPVGFAEVSLTISNENKILSLDYEEITLTRRLFRSGESEYFINKIPVRLKDISELLMGTGAGMRSYSLMEQGKVDQILSSRPQDRRSIFEEAAGITKYKSKKEEALRKLQRTQENLQRLGDIIVEVKRQIKSMERQVNKARRYKEEFEKLKEYELQVSQYQYQDFKKEKKQLEHRSKELAHAEASFNSKMAEVSHVIDRTRQDLSQVEDNLSQIQAENYEVQASIKTTNDKVGLNQERVEELIRRSQELAEQVQDLEQKITRSAEKAEEARNQVESLKQERKSKAASLLEKEEDIDNILAAVKEAQKKISEDKAKEVELIAQQTRLRNELTKLQLDLANHQARLRRLNVESEKTNQELNDTEEKHKTSLNEHLMLNEQLQKSTKELEGLKSNLNINIERQNTLNQDLEQSQRRAASAQSQLNFLKEITRKYEGFSQGVKSVLSACDSGEARIEGICGVVANLLEVSPRYRLAIEMVLQEFAQAIVVENSQAADQAIDYLKAKDAGRANFIALDSLGAIQAEGNIQDSLGRAKDFVTTDAKYAALRGYLLANTFVVRDIRTARRILQDIDPAVRLVTLKGEILTKESIISGSLPKDSNVALLGREERIAQSQAELKKLNEEKQGIENAKISQETEVENLKELIQEKEPTLNKLKIKLANKESEKANIEATKERFADEISVLASEKDETSEEIEQLQREQEGLNQQLSHFQEQQQALQNEIQAHQHLIAEKNQKKQNNLVQIAEAKTALAALDREEEQAQGRLEMLLESEQEQKQTKQLKAQQAQETTAKAEQLKDGIEGLKVQSEQFLQAKAFMEEKLQQAQQRRFELSTTIRDLDEQARHRQKELNELREKRTNLQVKLTELNYKQETLADRINQNYQVDLQATLEDTAEVSPPEDSILEEINRLKSRLQGLGPVNLVAIEENEQLQQRYSFLVSQQEDLIGAQESLRKAISQINHTARKMFAETFQKVQVSFKEYFRILFGGGDVRLILLDESNILESGIEIVVRPPGKRLQNITLLSGGEKALTAIALLFAIFKVKPSPFCILDEVDAALDEANIGRFTNLLAEFIKTSQFIIITHSKKTINMADIMYGITMEKSGISKIVSVRFTEGDELPAQEEEMAPVEG